MIPVRMHVTWNPVCLRFIKRKRQVFLVLESVPLSCKKQSRLNSDLLIEQYVDEGAFSLRVRVWAPFIAVFVVSYLVISSHKTIMLLPDEAEGALKQRQQVWKHDIKVYVLGLPRK
jgi:hypothetical protein